MNLIGENLLRRLECVFNHESAECRVLKFRGTGDQVLVIRTHSELDLRLAELHFRFYRIPSF